MHPVFHHIGIVGAGTMGSGIAQVFAQRGYAVSLCDLAAGQLERALNTIDKNLRRDVEKNRINPGQREQTLRNIQTHSDVNALAKSDMIIEAVSENFEVKKKVFASLDDSCALQTILASNTSSISITQLASVTQRGDTVATAIDLLRDLDKVAVEVNDSPGFVSNRVLMPMINEAIFCVFEEVGTVDAVDSVMKLGMNHPMGPLTLADLIGLDICLDIMETLYTGFNDSKYRPCPLLKKMVAAGHLGRKSGQGFYQYSQ